MNLATLLLIAQLKLKVLYLEQQLAALTATSAAIVRSPVTVQPPVTPVTPPETGIGPTISYDGKMYAYTPANNVTLQNLDNLDSACASSTAALQSAYTSAIASTKPGQVYWPNGSPAYIQSEITSKQNVCALERAQFVTEFGPAL